MRNDPRSIQRQAAFSFRLFRDLATHEDDLVLLGTISFAVCLTHLQIEAAEQ